MSNKTQSNQDLDRLLSIEEVAELLGVHRQTVYRYEGTKLPNIKCLGTKRGMLASEVKEAMANLTNRKDATIRVVQHLTKLNNARREGAAKRRKVRAEAEAARRKAARGA